ncbi:MAG: hypothetical protein A3F70_06695 [Acidobacteria bacterium RIFCSPLOWO2_12_FULL_67_14]|nr:MAG: hypothetical protein A3F70_06695 [Acidobacteria bacterium RIFCSPLOWO2_12_FULL_67_14]
MTKHWAVAASAITVVAGMLASTPATGSGQAPSTSTYKSPRTPAGHPDLQGIWQAVNSAVWDIEDHPATLGIPAGLSIVEGGEIPYLPGARPRRNDNYRNRQTADPESKCFWVGTPRIHYMPFPFEIVQTPGQVTVLYEYAHTTRYIYLTGRHPPGPISWYMGDSRARWEGDTLVVDVVHFADTNWLDRSGNYHSENMHLVERWTRLGPDHLMYEATIEDPTVFGRPWTIRFPLYRRIEPNAQLLEYECASYLELEKDRRVGIRP